MTKPVRLHLSRRKGFNLQAASRDANGLDAVNVSRPSEFGNPYKVSQAKFVKGTIFYGIKAAVEVNPSIGKKTAWKPITGEIKRKVLVTNNLHARDANGQMSHIWRAQMVHETKEIEGPYMAFDDRDCRIWGLTHFAEIPE